MTALLTNDLLWYVINRMGILLQQIHSQRSKIFFLCICRTVITSPDRPTGRKSFTFVSINSFTFSSKNFPIETNSKRSNLDALSASFPPGNTLLRFISRFSAKGRSLWWINVWQTPTWILKNKKFFEWIPTFFVHQINDENRRVSEEKDYTIYI